jgi:hypothetical protein
MGLSNNIIEDIKKKVEEKNTNISFFRDQILSVDAEKGQYDTAINILDNDLLSKIDEVNDTLYATQTAYQDRINVGCRTDLFWRVVGFSTGNTFLGTFNTFTLRCTKLSLSGYPRLSYSLTGIGDTSYASTLRYYDGTQFINYPLNTKFGWIEDNLHGIRYYDEPITKDVGNTKVTSFIGSIGTGTTELVVMTPFDNGLGDVFKEGQLILSDKEGVFPQAFNRIVGIGTTTTDFAELTLGIETVEISGVLYFVDSSGKILGLANSIVTDEIAVFGGSTIIFDANQSYNISSGITGGTGSQASFLVERNSSGNISSVQVTSGGSGYEVGDQLTVPGELIGGGGNIQSISFIGTIVGSSGTYNGVTGITNGSGINASFNIQRDDCGVITSVTLQNAGSGYVNGDTITISGSVVGGVDVTDNIVITTTSVDGLTGAILTFTFTASTISASATYVAVSGSTSGSGIGEQFTIQRDNCGVITSVQIINAGFRYQVGDTITILGSLVGGVDTVDDVVITVTQIADNDKIFISILDVSSPSIRSVVNTLILSDFATSDVTVPELDGSFVTFTVLDDPDNISSISEYSIPFEINPFSPQTIGIMNSDNIGIGRSVVYDNSGNLPNTQSWKPENAIQGVEDVPDVIEPSVGAGKIYYKVGFNQRPINPSNGSPALEGQTITLLFFTNVYQSLSACPTQETNLTNAINARDLKEAEFANELGEFNILLQASSALRNERDVFNSRIWGLRQSIGGEIDEIDRYSALETYIESSTVNNIIN